MATATLFGGSDVTQYVQDGSVTEKLNHPWQATVRLPTLGSGKTSPKTGKTSSQRTGSPGRDEGRSRDVSPPGCPTQTGLSRSPGSMHCGPLPI